MRLKEQGQVILFCKALEVPAVVVGRWVWVHFTARPADAIRDALKIAGFRWVKNRDAWAHNCGYYSRRGHGDPREKYGAVPVSSFREEELRKATG